MAVRQLGALVAVREWLLGEGPWAPLARSPARRRCSSWSTRAASDDPAPLAHALSVARAAALTAVTPKKHTSVRAIPRTIQALEVLPSGVV